MLSGAISYEPALDGLTVAAPAAVDPVLISMIHDACAARFRAGWQPVELHRVVARRSTISQAQLVRDAVAAHLRRFRRSDVDQRWLAQADALEAHLWWTDD